MGKKEHVKLTVSIVSLFIGGAIYVLFRPTTLLLFRTLRDVGMMGAVERMRECAAGWNLPGFVVNCLPNGLWVVAYILLMDVLWRNHSELTRLRWASIIPLAGCVAEAGQWFGYIPGTFDFWDFVCYAAPFVVYKLIIDKI